MRGVVLDGDMVLGDDNLRYFIEKSSIKAEKNQRVIFTVDLNRAKIVEIVDVENGTPSVNNDKKTDKIELSTEEKTRYFAQGKTFGIISVCTILISIIGILLLGMYNSTFAHPTRLFSCVTPQY